MPSKRKKDRSCYTPALGGPRLSHPRYQEVAVEQTVMPLLVLQEVEVEVLLLELWLWLWLCPSVVVVVLEVLVVVELSTSGGATSAGAEGANRSISALITSRSKRFHRSVSLIPILSSPCSLLSR